MANMTVRNVEDETKKRLRLRAARNGNSLEAELRLILRDAALAREESPQPTNLYDAIRELVEPHGGFEIPIPLRRPAARPIPFEDWDDEGDDHH
jgi:plasmid stability protein